MLLLPFLTGLSLVLHGTSSYVLGIHNNGDYSYSELIRKLSDYQQRLLQQELLEQEQQQQQQYGQKRRHGDRLQDDKVEYNYDPLNRESEINLAAEDPGAPPKTGEDFPGVVTAGLTDEVSTTTAKTTTLPPAPNPPQAHVAPEHNDKAYTVVKRNDFIFAAVVSACSVAGFVGLIMAGVCWYKLHRRVKAATDVDYPAYGVTGPTKERLPSPGDRKLAQSAQMYHYQHQKQQMIAMEKANGEMKQDGSEDESEEENEEGDYTVYECPGLAPTGEMEVRNPLFTEEAQTPVNGTGPGGATAAGGGAGQPDQAEEAQE